MIKPIMPTNVQEGSHYLVPVISFILLQIGRHFSGAEYLPINCDVTIDRSHMGMPSKGVFTSPGWPGLYPLNRRCHYRFIGLPTERVKMTFTYFDIQGVLPLCRFDYLDIYAQVKNISHSLMDTPVLGRFCDDNMAYLPKLVISTHNIIVLDFVSDDQENDRGFNGTYEFIDGSVYDIGNSVNSDTCEYVVDSSQKQSGYILSPTYPGFYSDRLHCTYLLQGRPGERIHIKFIDFSLYYGADYCPFDHLEVWDGRDIKGSYIGKFCGQHENVDFYSHGQFLYMVFITSSGRVDITKRKLYPLVDYDFERRGFNISFEFREDFVIVDSIRGTDIEHITGTECDVQVLSQHRSNGTIKSPGYPGSYPRNVVCKYILDGLNNPEKLEKIKVMFRDFEISGSMTSSCTKGYLKVEGSKESQGEKFCGNLLPPVLYSETSRLTLVLNTHNSYPQRGFSADYQFLIDYGIEGEQLDERKCLFLYDNDKFQDGTFNSPRYPGSNKEGTECTYVFRPQQQRKILISFFTFSLNTHNKDSCTHTDFLEIYEGSGINKKSISKYCGDNFPGPILGMQEMEIKYKARVFDPKSGFQASFIYVTEEELQPVCGHVIRSNGKSGILKSPLYPAKYQNYDYCKWKIIASRPINRILLNFFFFHVEGDGHGCKNAVVRLFNGSNANPMELCGKLPLGPRNETITTFLSEADTLELEFLTSGTAFGGKGFKISWTELHYETPVGQCYGFLCTKNRYCIDPDLKCDQIHNCGAGDTSDEVAGCQDGPQKSSSGPVKREFEVVHIAIGTSLSIFFCLVFICCGIYHRRRFIPHSQKRPDTDQVEVRYVAASSSCNTTDRLLTIDPSDGQTVISPVQSPTKSQNQVTKIMHNHAISGLNGKAVERSPDQVDSCVHSDMYSLAAPEYAVVNKPINKSGQSTPSRGTPSIDMPTRDTPLRDTPTRDTPLRDTPTRDMSVRDTPTRDMPLRDTPTRDTPPREVTMRETLPRGTPTRETPPQGTPPRGPPANGTATHQNISTVNRTQNKPPRIQKVSIV